MTQDIARFAAWSQSCRGGKFSRNVSSYRIVFSGISSFYSPSNRLYCADHRFLPIAGFFLSANKAGKLRESLASRGEQSQHPDEPLRLKETHSEMEQAKLEKGEHKPIRHSTTSAPRRRLRKKAQSRAAAPEEDGHQSKSEKLVCRYCGSNDLAPSFIKRRDCRCRKCFSKRYGSAARARKAKIKN